MTVIGKRTIEARLEHPRRAMVAGLTDVRLQVQPSGIDLCVEKVETFKGYGTIDFSNEHRQLPPTEPMAWVEYDDQPPSLWLPAGCYKVTFKEHVRIPTNMCSMPFPRSSLLRMGVNIYGALGDPGYRGKMVALLVVYNPRGFKLEKGARLVQLVFLKLDKHQEEYAGAYQDTT